MLQVIALLAIGFGLAGLGVYKSCQIGGWAALITLSGLPFVIIACFVFVIGVLGWAH